MFIYLIIVAYMKHILRVNSCAYMHELFEVDTKYIRSAFTYL